VRLRLRSLSRLPIVVVVALGLCGCTYASQGLDGAAGWTQGYDVSQVVASPRAMALVPEHVKADGILTVGSELTYPPMEFVAGDGQTAIGLDIDIARAVARVLGLSAEVKSASFDSIIPGIGPKYEVGISAFTITPERLDSVNMISYFSAGSQLAVRAGNPTDVSPDSLCGTRIAVQIGTVQQEDLLLWTESACDDNPITILPYETQADATANLLGGKVDAIYADSPIVDFAILQTEGRLELLGEMRDGANYGVVIAKDDEQLTVAVQAALQELMDNGTLTTIAELWGNGQGAMSEALLNPLSFCGNAKYDEPALTNIES